MQIVFAHGLNSSCYSEKGEMLRKYCAEFYPQIDVSCPDLNCPPDEVVAKLTEYLARDKQSVLVGLSLGGFFAIKLHEQFGCKMVLLNPSIQPHLSLRRFFPKNKDFDQLPDDYIGMVTAGYWAVTAGDLRWFERHAVAPLTQPERCLLIVKQGDDLLDYRVAVNYAQNALQIVEAGGDHRMSDFDTKLPQVIRFLFPELCE